MKSKAHIYMANLIMDEVKKKTDESKLEKPNTQTPQKFSKSSKNTPILSGRVPSAQTFSRI